MTDNEVNENKNTIEKTERKNENRTMAAIFCGVCAVFAPIIIWTVIFNMSSSVTAICLILLSYTLGVVGLVLGLKSRKSHKTIAITAIVLSILGLVLTTLLILAIYIVISGLN